MIFGQKNYESNLSGFPMKGESPSAFYHFPGKAIVVLYDFACVE